MKEPLRGYLRRRIQKFERPKSLFGNLPYSTEQKLVATSLDGLFIATTAYRPDKTLLITHPAMFLPRKNRESKIKKNVKKAYQNLKAVVG